MPITLACMMAASLKVMAILLVLVSTIIIAVRAITKLIIPMSTLTATSTTLPNLRRSSRSILVIDISNILLSKKPNRRITLNTLTSYLSRPSAHMNPKSPILIINDDGSRVQPNANCTIYIILNINILTEWPSMLSFALL
jgi:hypothetical protein